MFTREHGSATLGAGCKQTSATQFEAAIASGTWRLLECHADNSFLQSCQLYDTGRTLASGAKAWTLSRSRARRTLVNDAEENA